MAITKTMYAYAVPGGNAAARRDKSNQIRPVTVTTGRKYLTAKELYDVRFDAQAVYDVNGFLCWQQAAYKGYNNRDWLLFESGQAALLHQERDILLDQLLKNSIISRLHNADVHALRQVKQILFSSEEGT